MIIIFPYKYTRYPESERATAISRHRIPYIALGTSFIMTLLLAPIGIAMILYALLWSHARERRALLEDVFERRFGTALVKEKRLYKDKPVVLPQLVEKLTEEAQILKQFSCHCKFVFDIENTAHYLTFADYVRQTVWPTLPYALRT